MENSVNKNYVVCGWYTPDYAHWLQKLIPSLDTYGAPHDFVEVPKLDGGWERNTMQKASQLHAAMLRHPTKTIVFLDVDCVVRGPLDMLANITGDIGLYLRTRFQRSGRPKSGWRSGTLVLRQTNHAKEFVERWVALSHQAPRYGVDQDSLAVAIGQVPGLSVTTLDVAWCATEGDACLMPIIRHDSASRDIKTSRWKRLFAA